MSFHIIQFPRTYLCNIFGENASVEAPDLQTCQMFPCCYIFFGIRHFRDHRLYKKATLQMKLGIRDTVKSRFKKDLNSQIHVLTQDIFFGPPSFEVH